MRSNLLLAARTSIFDVITKGNMLVVHFKRNLNHPKKKRNLTIRVYSEKLTKALDMFAIREKSTIILLIIKHFIIYLNYYFSLY